MHELAIARSIIGIVERAAAQEGFRRVLEIRLTIGEYSGLMPDCLREFFPIAARGSCAEGAALVMVPLAARFQCDDCGFEGGADRKKACCPRCQSTAIRMIRGREFYVDNLKVE